MAFDPYAILGVDRHADDATIRRRWKEIAQVEHPDKNPGNPYATERFKQFKEAYEILMDPDRRARSERGESTRKFDPMPAAIGIIIACMHAALAKTGHRQLIEHIRADINQRIAKNNQSLTHGEEMIAGLTISKDKFIYNGSDRNIIVDGIDAQMVKVRESITECENSQKTYDLAFRILEDYDDIEDVQLPNFVHMSTTTGSSSTGGW